MPPIRRVVAIANGVFMPRPLARVALKDAGGFSGFPVLPGPGGGGIFIVAGLSMLPFRLFGDTFELVGFGGSPFMFGGSVVIVERY